jgi:hypothetical protein
MPGSGQWRVLEDGEEKCWCCENQIYALVFWSLAFGKETDNAGYSHIVNQLKTVNNNFTGMKFDGPVYFSAETSWRPTALDKLQTFINKIDNNASNLFEDLKASGEIRKTLKSEAEMNSKEQKLLQDRFEKFCSLYYGDSTAIKKIMIKSLRYR